MDRGGWLPFVRFADFIDTFDLTVRTPERFTVLGIGKKVSDDAADGIRTTRWTAEKPVSFPTIIFGDYLSAVSDHIVKKSDGTPIPVTVYVDKVSTNALDTRILDTKGTQGTQAELDEMRSAGASGARDIRGKQLGPIAVQAAIAIELYQQIYGVDYPYAKLDLVADPLGSFYGQAPSSIIYLGFGVFRGEGQVAAGGMFGGGSSIARFNKDVVAHETGHQWWGSVICNANQRNYWFVETLAEVSSALYVEKVFGRKKYDEKVAVWRDNVMKFDQVTSVQNNYTVWGGEDGFRSVQSNIYDKGPYAFHVFRETFGDEKFFALLKELAQELQHKEIVTRDIQDVMEKVVGGNMDWFFDQWIRGIGKPQYALNYTTRKNEQGKWIVEGTIKQRVVYGKYRDPMPGVFYRGVAPLTFVSPDGKEVKSAKPLLVQGPETPFRVIVADEPAQVFFNKDGEILAEDTLINRSW
jgi:aminopeptidase N